MARQVPFYEYDEAQFFRSDDAPSEIAERRRAGFMRLAEIYRAAVPSHGAGHRRRRGRHLRSPVHRELPGAISVSAIGTSAPARRCLRAILLRCEGHGPGRQRAVRPHRSYGVNVFGYDFYKECIRRGSERVEELGPVLGAYHPVVAFNVARLREISGQEEVSFHMSGTEAVMQAVRLARYHTRRSHLVRFCGAYHGWWGDVQPGVGNPSPAVHTYTLKDMDDDSLRVLRTRRDIACVLVNPLQALHPNANAPGDAALVDSARAAHFDRQAYQDWLRKLRAVCTERGIVLIFDEVFVGFRLAAGGRAGVFRRARGHGHLWQDPGWRIASGCAVRTQATDETVPRRAPHGHLLRARHIQFAPLRDGHHERVPHPDPGARDSRLCSSNSTLSGMPAPPSMNQRLEAEGLPVRVAHLSSIWTVMYQRPSRYNWMLQFYLRAEGLALSWVGTGRFIFSINYSDDDFAAVVDRFVAAARAMDADGFWWSSPALTNKAIKRRILREMIAARI